MTETNTATLSNRVASRVIDPGNFSEYDAGSLMRRLCSEPYSGYAYSYPHKSAYRPLAPKRTLQDVWSNRRQQFSTYVHIPFCEMRCGFCNLFTAANLPDDITEAYLDAFQRQVEVTVDQIGVLKPRSLTLGGGTPTYLSAQQLARMFDLLAQKLDCDTLRVPTFIETSPKTATNDRLDLLQERGVDRISIGVQSFVGSEACTMGRAQSATEVCLALDRIRNRSFKTLNIDLIYGAEGQTVESFETSIRAALQWSPEEIFIYPLYVRPLTGLAGLARVWNEQRRACYRAGRELLLREGYTQLSMRMFRRHDRDDASGSAHGEAGWVDEDVVGLGCGARSRTRTLHYSSGYAVGRAGVLAILSSYCQAKPEVFSEVCFGIELDDDERMRRTVIGKLLNCGGIDLLRLKRQFAKSLFEATPILADLNGIGLLESDDNHVSLSVLGYEFADAIGPLLYSPAVTSLMQEFVCE